jgi:site-specific DNA recombinase
MPTEPSNPSIRAAGYTRVSTGRQAEKGLSLDEQRRRIEEFASNEGWELAHVYEERGVSGRKADRPALNQMLRERSRFDRLIVPKLDRLGRSASSVYDTIRQLNEAGIRLVSLDPAIDTTTREGRFLLNALVGIAEMESDLNSERVRDTAEARVARGRDYGSRRPPYGYCRGGDGILIPIPKQAAVVKRIFAEFLAGRGQREIERSLIEDGIPPSAGGIWRPGTVSQMLRQVIYSGRVKAPSGAIYDGLHDGVIEIEAFERAQALLAANRSSGVRRQTASGHLLRGRMAICAHCGRTIQARTERGRGFYLCGTRKAWGAHACPMSRISRDLIDGAILGYFESAVLDLEATRLQIEEAIDRKLGETRTLREHAEAEAARAEERLARVRRDYQDGKLDADDWAEQKAH